MTRARADITAYTAADSTAALVGAGYIGPVVWAGHEVLRRIFVTVRDRDWREIPPALWQCELDEEACTAAITSRYTSERVDFEWEGLLQVARDEHTLKFSMRGRALRAMEVCRIGLVVLHPVDSLVGSQLRAMGPNADQTFTVGKDIYPQAMTAGVPQAMTEPFSRLRVERADFGVLDLKFEGELFELEDQRNWGDASFKTYCTPLRMGFPRSVAKGTTITHRVEACFTPAKALRGAAPLLSIGASGPRSRAALSGRFPAIGRQWLAESRVLPAGALWDHVHVDVPLSGAIAAIRQAVAEQTAAQIQLGVGMEEGGAFGSAVVETLSSLPAGVVRILLYGVGATSPTAKAVEALREILRHSPQPHIPVLAATRGYYVELNRGLPHTESVSGTAFPLTATVHNDDPDCINDNVVAVRDMAETARRLFGKDEVVVAPLSLYYPRTPNPPAFLQQLVAPWLTATLIHAATGQITAVTLGTDVLAALARTGPGYTRELLEEFTRCAGAQVDLLDTSTSPGLHAAALTSPQHGRRILVANPAETARVLSFAGVGVPSEAGRDAVTRDPIFVHGSEVQIPACSVVWFGRTRAH